MDALRHGWPIRIADSPVLLPIETGFAPGSRAEQMLISAARAETLALSNQRAAAAPDTPVLIRAGSALSVEDTLPIADPALDLAFPLKGPFVAEHLPWAGAAAEALELARIAGILPAFMINPHPTQEVVALAEGDSAALTDPINLHVASRANLPIADSEDAAIWAFRSVNDTREHAALVIGSPNSDRTPLVRVHSECLTGDVFSSLKCDCGPQLDGALSAIAGEADNGGWGAVLYLRQEGRGIGLINKLRAYQLQDQGFDTVEANERLGLPDEARDFRIAARMLNLMHIDTIKLLTNNPAKVAGLERAGISIAERVPLRWGMNTHNARYLATKRDKAGHLLE